MGLVTLLLPLTTACFAWVFNRRMGTHGTFIFLLTGMSVTTILSYFLLFTIIGSDNFVIYEYLTPVTWSNFYWGSMRWGFIWDSTTAIMVSTVCTVSTLVHLYSWYYMGVDPYFRRFVTYLSLFTFFMLFLVGSNNLLQLFFGWEGVGLCSYLLINFWFTRRQANKAAIKAVMVNRFGDCGLIFAIILVVNYFGCLEYGDIFTSLIFEKSDTLFAGFRFIDFVCFLLFIGVMAKSAQAGLHTWLPDAMEGPTPVSALIHAATMVTAGIYMMIRMFPAFECSPKILTGVALVGGLTALFAATTALFQHDLKKVIAYSTCSQLGYMVMACGIDQFSLSFFHLVNHAFFKALLFLGAGAVIHSFAGEQDVRKMGAIGNIFPIGLATTVISSAALAGLPFLAGFYSKDVILGVLLLNGTVVGNILWVIGCVSAICTSMYSWSLVYFIFFGKPRGSLSSYRDLHEVTWHATLPMVLLSLLSVSSGFILKDMLVGAGNEVFLGLNSADSFLSKAAWFSIVEWVPLVVKVLIGLIGFVGAVVYYSFETVGSYVSYPIGWIYAYKFLFHRWYWDQVYNNFISWPVFRCMYSIVYKILDKGFIESSGVLLTSWVGVNSSFFLARIQNGSVARYLAISAIGAAVSWYIGVIFLWG